MTFSWHSNTMTECRCCHGRDASWKWTSPSEWIIRSPCFNNLFFFSLQLYSTELYWLCVHKPLQLQLNGQYVIPEVSSWSESFPQQVPNTRQVISRYDKNKNRPLDRIEGKCRKTVLGYLTHAWFWNPCYQLVLHKCNLFIYYIFKLMLDWVLEGYCT